MPVSKKDKKNGKDSGGVVAAVTKHAAKFSNGNSAKALSSSPSPPVQSPDIKPATPASNDTNPIASPLLDAVSTTSFATSNSNSLSTREWTRGIPAGMAGSPGNLISLVGESPPTAPSSYEDNRGGLTSGSGWSSPRPYPSYLPASASPPSAVGRRPLSYHMDTHYSLSPPDAHGHFASVAANRRSSMHSHLSHARGSPNPPLPHQPQAHFYGAPDIDLDPQQSKPGIQAGARGYYFGFDALPTAGGDVVPGKDSVVLAGYEGGLEVYSVAKRGVELVGSLKGLRGGVYHAKILPWTAAGPDIFPLVAVVVHGPSIQPPTPGLNAESDYDAVSADRSEAMANVSNDGSARDNPANRISPGFYQTTVEVYSLTTGRLVSVLLEAPRIPLKVPITSPIFKAPSPVGAFHIHADDGSIVVASGVTGECWIYRQAPVSSEHGLQIKCHGKVWTTLQQSLRDTSPEAAGAGRIPVPPRPRPQSAILSLNGRWIAYCPATPSSQISLRAVVPVPPNGRAPGLNSLTPPQLPPANSDVDLPLTESVMNKIMRDATQELIQGARWVGKQGLQAWNSYWNPQSSQPARPPTMVPQGWGGLAAQSAETTQFPPTHGTVTPPVAKEPGIVSILDVESLGVSANVHPVTTFAIPQGCSFLSLSPSGLFLFTASSKGDVQTVWDLMRIQYTKASPIQGTGAAGSGGPRVRQVAQFSRMTVARVVDVVWTRPNGERAAMVTERGTVHLLDLPSSAFTWPPPRRRTRAEEGKGPGAEGTTTSAVSIASNALSSVREVARPLMTRPRRSNSNALQTAGPGIGEYATHGGKVIAASISHSLGKTGNAINQLRHNGENRVSLPNTATMPMPSCVTWITGRKDHSLFVLGGGLVRSYPSKSRRSRAGDNKAPRLSRYQEFNVPRLPDDVLSPLIQRLIDPDEYLDFTEKDLDGGNNTMVLHQFKARAPTYDLSAESSIPQAEIETNAPYQPFHTDRRITFWELEDSQGPTETQNQAASISSLMAAASLEDAPDSAPPRRKAPKGSRMAQIQQHTVADSSASSPSSGSYGAWTFGQPIRATKLDMGFGDEESFNIASYDMRALPSSAMERVLYKTGDDDAQIVITTRRRRGAGHAASQDDDGFFEDDCEVLDFADQRV
ncbi:hypothetical protein B0T16DRAFT_375422 [Cercophora newfieldiana]|uniref:Uncharacterized protein n=1 Tax=Cercophora newfieldiana TaxID=92897 RepID=A0AA39Y625_9PEZI|nr:hypothetical protein B0T16DRAFT_375422 [Cercophora newfieldiana]